MPEVLRAELFDREPSMSLLPGRAASIRLMKWTPGEFSAERFSKAVAPCTAVVWTWGFLESDSASKQEKVVEAVGPLQCLLHLWLELNHCDLATMHAGMFPTVHSISHHPSVSTRLFVNSEHEEGATVNCYSILLHFYSSASHDYLYCFSIQTFIFLEYRIIGYGINWIEDNSYYPNSTYIFIARSFSSTITKVSYFMHIK